MESHDDPPAYHAPGPASMQQYTNATCTSHVYDAVHARSASARACCAPVYACCTTAHVWSGAAHVWACAAHVRSVAAATVFCTYIFASTTDATCGNPDFDGIWVVDVFDNVDNLSGILVDSNDEVCWNDAEFGCS